MTDSKNPANDLPALLEERRKFEGWLAALDARRASTPQHVFDRVRGDYETRMRQVEERLAAHRHSILDERTSLESRRALLEAEEQLRRDERAELELRAHVGELSSEESDSSFRAVDEALESMTEEKSALTKRIGELDALLDLKAPEPSSDAPTADATQPEDVVAETKLAADSATPTSDIEELTLEDVEIELPAKQESAGNKPGAGVHTPGGSFDELAFLTDVVGLKEDKSPVETAPDEKPLVVREESTGSILDGVMGSAAEERKPLASNVGNTPIVLRSSGAIEHSKTLKCTECGAMNYPTEWYCERCGAELAAL